MKTFDESLVSIDILEKPEAWALSMAHVTGTDIDDLCDYAKRRRLMNDLEKARQSQIAFAYHNAINEAVRYLLGIGR